MESDGLDLVALAHGVDDILALGDLTEDRVLPIEMGRGLVGDEELAAVGIRSGIGHRKDAGFGVLQRAVDFVGKLVARTATAGAGWISALDHEVGNDPVEGDPVVVAALGEVEEIRGRDGHLGGEDGGLDVALVGVQRDADVGHGGQNPEARDKRPEGNAACLSKVAEQIVAG